MAKIIATIPMKLIRVKKFSQGKISNSIFHIIHQTAEIGIRNARPNGNGPIASQISLAGVDFQGDITNRVVIGEMKFRIDSFAKPTLEIIKANFKKQMQSLGLYKIILQKTKYQ